MKKILLATTALVVSAGAASAAEWSVGVGGYGQIGVGFADGFDGVGILRDGEIHISPRLTADNGLTFGGRVEFEATTATDTIDENYFTVGGSFGTIKIGADDSAKNAYHNGVLYAPGARVGYYDAFGLTANNQMQGIAGSGDFIGIHYDSPDFMGFRFGATYQPNRGNDGTNDTGVVVFEESNAATAGDNFYAFGAVYSASFDQFGVGIGAGYADADGFADDQYHVSGNVSFSGFTVAGFYEDDGTDEYGIGARYSTGPWTVAAGYADADGAGGEVFAGWVSYAMAPGVTATAGLEHHDDGADSQIAGLAYLQLNF